MAQKNNRNTMPRTNSLLLGIHSRPGRSTEWCIAEKALSGVTSNAVAATQFSKHRFGELSLQESVSVLEEKAKLVNAGDLSDAEALLAAQIATLNSIFTELALRSSATMGEHLDVSERFMRLALKAQTQCRATVETLAILKNPPIVYARQANISQGPQQVNNNIRVDDQRSSTRSIRAQARTRENPRNGQNKLLEPEYEKRLDHRTTIEAVCGDQELESVAPLDRSKHRSRES